MYYCVRLDYFVFSMRSRNFELLNFFKFCLDAEKLEIDRKFQVFDFNGLNGWVGLLNELNG